jgi:hypothetical protein
MYVCIAFHRAVHVAIKQKTKTQKKIWFRNSLKHPTKMINNEAHVPGVDDMQGLNKHNLSNCIQVVNNREHQIVQKGIDRFCNQNSSLTASNYTKFAEEKLKELKSIMYPKKGGNADSM